MALDSSNKIHARGFTLLEILLTIVVLTVGLMGMAALTTGLMRYNAFANEMAAATTLAQDKMEDIFRLGFQGTPSADSSSTEDYGTIPGFFPFKRVLTLKADTPFPGMKKIQVKVYWDADAHSAELVTLLGH